MTVKLTLCPKRRETNHFRADVASRKSKIEDELANIVIKGASTKPHPDDTISE